MDIGRTASPALDCMIRGTGISVSRLKACSHITSEFKSWDVRQPGEANLSIKRSPEPAVTRKNTLVWVL